LALLLAAGALGLAIGWAASGGNGWLPWEFTPLVPMIKKLWTSSFAIYAAGWTFLMLALFYFLIEVLDLCLWSFPFMVVGMNSIAMYMAASLFTDKARQAAGLFVEFAERQGYGLDPAWKPVVLAVSAVFIFWLFCLWLYRRRIFFKV
jgi:predicted acyltransferase